MTDVWKETTLKAACLDKGQYGFTATADSAAQGPHLLRTTDITSGTIDWTSVPRCELNALDKAKYLLQDGDIVICRMGTVGVSSFIVGAPEAVFASYLVRFRPNPDVVLPAYLAYTLQSDGWWDYVEAVRAGTVQPTLNATLMAGFTFPLPPMPEQARSVEVLSAIDERLAKLRQLELTLAQTILADCQVAAEDREGSGTLSLSDAVTLVNGGAYTKGATGTGRMVIRIKELNTGASDTTVYNDIAVPTNKTAYPGDVLFAWSGSLGVWRWYGDEAIVNQHIFKVLPGAHPVWLGWSHIINELDTFRDIAAGKATTMGHITKDHLIRAQVPLFGEGELAALSTRVQPLWDYQLRVGREIESLKELKTFVMPRLLSAELSVMSAADIVEFAS